MAERMSGVNWKAMHGARGEQDWAPPLLVRRCDR
jgi:hypothetical protein